MKLRASSLSVGPYQLPQSGRHALEYYDEAKQRLQADTVYLRGLFCDIYVCFSSGHASAFFDLIERLSIRKTIASHKGLDVNKLLAPSAVVSTILMFPQAVLADEDYAGMRPLAGQFELTGATPIDPPENEDSNTHLRLRLTGDAAKTLFDNMPVKAEPETCGDRRDWVEKRIESMLCVTDYHNYECFFAIDIVQQKVDGGWAC